MADVPLSALKPQEFIDGVKPILEKLAAADVNLTGIQLGNEINLWGFSGENLLHRAADTRWASVISTIRMTRRHARSRRLSQLSEDRVGAQVAGDLSEVNSHTPIVCAGTANWALQRAWGLAVCLVDGIAFLRQNGLDKYVDGYGAHDYPGLDPSRSVATRIASRVIFLAPARTPSPAG
jgi:hypothetical protein